LLSGKSEVLPAFPTLIGEKTTIYANGLRGLWIGGSFSSRGKKNSMPFAFLGNQFIGNNIYPFLIKMNLCFDNGREIPLFAANQLNGNTLSFLASAARING
jgi:hypothetical protein